MIDSSDIELNQKYINFWTAYAFYDDLVNFCNNFIIENDNGLSITFDDNDLFNKDYNNKSEELNSYCIRSKVIKMATETCEIFCKAMLIDEGKKWDEMKGLGHNLSKLIDALPEDKKQLLLSMPIDYFMHLPTFHPIHLTPAIFDDEDEIEDNYKEMISYIDSYSQGKILPNIKARYPGESLVDFNGRFIVALVKLLYSLAITYTDYKDYYSESLIARETENNRHI